MADSYTVTIDGNEVIKNLTELEGRVKAGLEVVGQTVGAQMKS